MDGPLQTVNMPQWTHADWPPGKQAAHIAAKQRLQYGGVMPVQPPRIQMHTGDLYQTIDFGDGRWGAKLIKAAGPDGKLGEVFVAEHGAEHISWAELSTGNIRTECGVVKLEGRVDGHDEQLKELRKLVKRLENELAEARGQIKGLRVGQTGRSEQEPAEKVRVLELD